MELTRWVRVGLVALLAAPQLFIGVWSLAMPNWWYDDFPGFHAKWVAASGPYNEHLVSDIGAGFLATRVALALAAWWGRRQPAVLALATYLVFSVPHALYHSFTRVDSLSTADQVLQAGSLWSGVAFALVLLVGATSSLRHRRLATA